MLVIHSVTFIPVVLTQHIHQIFKLYPLRGYYCEGKKKKSSHPSVDRLKPEKVLRSILKWNKPPPLKH